MAFMERGAELDYGWVGGDEIVEFGFEELYIKQDFSGFLFFS